MVNLVYSYSSNQISNQPTLDEQTNRLVSTVTNGESSQMVSINFSIPFTATKWWSMQNNLWGNWMQSTNFYKQRVKQEFTNCYFNSTQTFSLPKNISLELSGWCNTGSVWGLYRFRSIGMVNFGAQKKFEKKRSTLSFNIWNLLNSARSNQFVNIPEQNLIVRTMQNFGYTTFSITYNHRFGKETVKGKRERSTGAEDERGRAY